RLQGDWSSDVCSSDLASTAFSVGVIVSRDVACQVLPSRNPCTKSMRRSKLRLRQSSDNGGGYARDKYTPSAVSTLIFSPSLMKGGTCTTSPVSVLAALVTLEAVALFIPGSVSITANSTVCGSSIPTALPSKNSTLISRLGIR